MIGKFKEKIATELNDNSTLLDILNILNSYKINFQKILKTINVVYLKVYLFVE